MTHSHQRKVSSLHSNTKTLTGSGSPAERCGTNTDGIKHHRLAILVRVAPRCKHPVEGVEGSEIDEQATRQARKLSLFRFCVGHDGRSAQRERDIGRLGLDDVVRDLVQPSVSAEGSHEMSVYNDRKGGRDLL